MWMNSNVRRAGNNTTRVLKRDGHLHGDRHCAFIYYGVENVPTRLHTLGPFGPFARTRQ